MAKRFFLGCVAGGVSACVYVQRQWTLLDNNTGQAGYILDKKAQGIHHHPRLGSHPLTYYSYAKLREQPLDAKPLTEHLSSVDVCVIGGGFAGLHTALALAEKGKRVVVLERRQVGCGASGRNGGDAIVGFHTPAEELAGFVGEEKAAQLYEHSLSGYERLKHLIKYYKIQCGMEEVGAITMSFHNRVARSGKTLEALMNEEEASCREVQQKYSEELQVWSPEKVSASGLKSQRYSYGVFNPRNMALNPLELALGLARACKSKGVVIYEASPVTAVFAPNTSTHHSHPPHQAEAWIVETPSGSVQAKDVVLATASAPMGIAPELAIATAPLVTAMMLTKPIEKGLLDAVLTNKYAVFDERFALAYYRRVEGNRIMYGSLARGLPMKQSWAEAKLIADLTTTFPTLAGHVQADFSWQGRLDAKLPVFPMLGRTSKGLWYSLGFSGHGLVPTCAAGELLASAIVNGGTDTRYKLWNEVSYTAPYSWMPTHAPIGGPLGQLGSIAFCYWTGIKDRLEQKF